MTWSLDPNVEFLNHGSFGATPTPVLAAQADIRDRMERQPVRFFQRDREALLDAARTRLGEFIGAHPEDLAFVANATTGVNAVIRSLRFQPGEELLTTDHAYNACRNALEWVAQRDGASVVVARVPFPLSDGAAITASILDAVTDRTRLALVDHVTSPTALVFPIQEVVAALEARGVDTLVDGAHAPGMVPVDIESIGAAYYAGNCHKWMCAPKGAGFLWVRRDRHDGIVPVVVSHGANSERKDRPRFRLLFDWVGTEDLSAYLAVGAAIDFMSGLHPDGWKGVMDTNGRLALGGRDALISALGIPPPAPDHLLGSMASVPLPPGDGPAPIEADPFQDRLLAKGFEVPIAIWPSWPRRLLRISAQAYNTADQYERLANGLVELLSS